MVDYYKAFDENYVPIDVEKGIEQQTEEMFNIFVDQYRTMIYEGILQEDYGVLKNAAHSIKGSLGYLNPITLDKISNELQIFIRERIEEKDGKTKYPFTEEDKKKIYKDSLYILTEMVALLRYFHKKYDDFKDQYNYESAKKLIDQCYKFYFDRFKIPYADDKRFDKQPTNQTEKLQKSSVVQVNNASLINENSVLLKDSTMRQPSLISIKEDPNKKKHEKGAAPSNIDQSTAIANSIVNGKRKEEGVGQNDIKLESEQKTQPCCNVCNIF